MYTYTDIYIYGVVMFRQNRANSSAEKQWFGWFKSEHKLLQPVFMISSLFWSIVSYAFFATVDCSERFQSNMLFK